MQIFKVYIHFVIVVLDLKYFILYFFDSQTEQCWSYEDMSCWCFWNASHFTTGVYSHTDFNGHGLLRSCDHGGSWCKFGVREILTALCMRLWSTFLCLMLTLHRSDSQRYMKSPGNPAGDSYSDRFAPLFLTKEIGGGELWLKSRRDLLPLGHKKTLGH